MDIAIACTRFRGCGVAEKGNPSVPDFRFLQEVGMIVLLSAMSVKGKKEKGFEALQRGRFTLQPLFLEQLCEKSIVTPFYG